MLDEVVPIPNGDVMQLTAMAMGFLAVMLWVVCSGKFGSPGAIGPVILWLAGYYRGPKETFEALALACAGRSDEQRCNLNAALSFAGQGKFHEGFAITIIAILASLISTTLCVMRAIVDDCAQRALHDTAVFFGKVKRGGWSKTIFKSLVMVIVAMAMFKCVGSSEAPSHARCVGQTVNCVAGGD